MPKYPESLGTDIKEAMTLCKKNSSLAPCTCILNNLSPGQVLCHGEVIIYKYLGAFEGSLLPHNLGLILQALELKNEGRVIPNPPCFDKALISGM